MKKQFSIKTYEEHAYYYDIEADTLEEALEIAGTLCHSDAKEITYLDGSYSVDGVYLEENDMGTEEEILELSKKFPIELY